MPRSPRISPSFTNKATIERLHIETSVTASIQLFIPNSLEVVYREINATLRKLPDLRWLVSGLEWVDLLIPH